MERNDWKWLRVRCAMNSGNIIFTRGVVAVRGICCDRLYGRRVTGQRNLYDKVLLQNTRDKIDKLHKGVMNRNVQNKKIKYLKSKRLHAAGRSKTNRKLNLFRQKTEKWLDNRGFGVYTALVSHNGLVRQKGSCDGCHLRGHPEKFVQNAGRFRRTRVELCVSAQI